MQSFDSERQLKIGKFETANSIKMSESNSTESGHVLIKPECKVGDEPEVHILTQEQ